MSVIGFRALELEGFGSLTNSTKFAGSSAKGGKHSSGLQNVPFPEHECRLKIHVGGGRVAPCVLLVGSVRREGALETLDLERP